MYSGSSSGSMWGAEDLGPRRNILLDGYGTEPAELLSGPPPLVGGSGGLMCNLVGYEDGWGVPHREAKLQADYYNETDDTKRGLPLASMDELLAGKSQAIGCDGDDFSLGGWWFDKATVAHPEEAVPHPEAAVAHPEFTDDVQPAEVPFGGPACTSVTLDCDSAAKVASTVHTFLATEVTSSFHKVRTHKFSMKADVFIEVGNCPSQCTLKARVYRTAQPSSAGQAQQLVVEFSRHRGDVVGFKHIFDQAARYLRDRCGAHSAGTGQMEALTGAESSTAAPLPELSAPSSGLAEPELGLLLDMVSAATVPALQAEAVVALTAVVSASSTCAALVLAVWGRIQEVLVTLMASTEIDVAYPAARLALQLAQRDGGETVAKRLVLAACRAVMGSSDRLVRLELAEVVRLGALRAAASTACQPELCAAVEEALLANPADHADVAGRLREALETLKASVPYHFEPLSLSLSCTAAVA